MQQNRGPQRLIRIRGRGKRILTLGVATGLAASMLAAATPAGARVPNADPGITKTELAIGFPTVLSGPAANIVRFIPVAQQAYIDHVNETEGGINGRKIKAVVEDAGSQDAATALAAVTKLKDQAFILEASDGTIFAPLADRFKVPTLFAFGGKALSEDKYGFMVQTYADYQSGKLLPDYLLNELDAKDKTIAVIYQPDGFTTAANDAFIAAAKKKKLNVVIDQPIDAAAATCSQEVANVGEKKPDITVVLALRSALCTFREMQAQGLKTYITGIGGTYGVNTFLNLAPGLLEGTTMLGTFPPLTSDPNDKCSAEFIEIMKEQVPENLAILTDEAAYSGYLIGRHVVKELEKAGKNLTRAGFVKFLSKQKNYSDGCLPPVSYGPGDKRQGATSVNVWEVKNNRFVLKDPKFRTSFK